MSMFAATRSRNSANHHADWLSLLEVNGPFLALPVLQKTFPQGLESRDRDLAAELRAAYEEWLDNQQGLQPDPAIHRVWSDYVLGDLLGFPPELLVAWDDLDPQQQARLTVPIPEHGVTLRPDDALLPPSDSFASTAAATTPAPRLLVRRLPAGASPDRSPAGDGWVASHAARMVELLRAANVRLGLLTNGEQWMLVDAPKGETAGFVSWYAELWFDEPVTLRAFTTLLSLRRFFGVPADETLEALLAASAGDQQEVTDRLGYQVRRAVELLVQALHLHDQERDRQRLAQVSLRTLFDAAVTVMMRLVFLFKAEETDLLPVGNAIYARHYALSTLHDQLRAVADQSGEEVLEHRYDAWPRLLALFRAVHAGVYHDNLSLPAYGGDLFDPATYPFLDADVDNRTVLHLLASLQFIESKGAGDQLHARRVSFRGLDVEQIGHVYEGLLDHTVARADAPVIGLVGTQAKEPEVGLDALEALCPQPVTAFHAWPAAAQQKLLDFLKEQTGRSVNALRNGFTALPPDLLRSQALRIACANDPTLYARISPWHGLIRDDDYGRPVVFPSGTVYVTAGTTRRATGTHYTPRSLTEPIVRHTLEPLVYRGPAEGMPPDRWTLRPAADLLKLKLCDMAMGSGAFLVEACRYLAARLVEAWQAAETTGRDGKPRSITVDGLPAAHPDHALPADAEERLLLARRIVAARSLYGVDKNALAVEMAKLSLWLITLDKHRPFTFLNHALKCGDSLVGVDLNQLRRWSLDTGVTAPTAALTIDVDVDRVIALRQEIERMPDLDLRDQTAKAYKLAQAEAIAHELKRAGDMLVASYYNTLSKAQQATLRAALLESANHGADLDAQWRPHAGLGDLRPFHWPLEFPEVFLADGRGGFDAFVGNPPFIGGKRISTVLSGGMNSMLKLAYEQSKGAADYVAYFLRRAFVLLNSRGCFGLIATNSISEADTKEVGLEYILRHKGKIFRADTTIPWPGSAGVAVSIVYVAKGVFSSMPTLNSSAVSGISATLDTLGDEKPFRLKLHSELYTQGPTINGEGFIITPDEYHELIHKEPRNAEVLSPYLNGQYLNSLSSFREPRAYVINFRNWEYSIAAQYPDVFGIVESRVKAKRESLVGQVHESRYWLHWDRREEFFERYRSLDAFLASTITTKYLAFTFVPPDWYCSHAIKLFALATFDVFSLLQSSLHDVWARRYCSQLETRLRYSTSDAFDTFAFPITETAKPILGKVGSEYYRFRLSVMEARDLGLTATYNRFHAPAEAAADIAHLRQLHVEMDHAVAAAYGWSDLDLGHGFHDTQQGIRYTISETARRTVLARLLELNHARYAEELRAGLHAKKQPTKQGKTKPVADDQMELL